jgi:hypothetical protein
MAAIIINVDDPDDYAEACRVVARQIEEGYTNGLIGWSANSWSIEE